LIVKARESLRCVPTDDETLQEGFAGVVARAIVEPGRDIESLPLAAERLGDFVRGRILGV
jgi:hypothetical protein